MSYILQDIAGCRLAFEEVNANAPSVGAGVRAGYFSESTGVAAGKFAVMAWLEKNRAAARYIRHLSGDDNYAAPRALFLVFKWLVKQPGWASENGMGEVEYVLWKQGRMATDHDRAELENLLLDFCNQEIEGTKNYKLKFYNVLHGLLKYHKVQLPNSDISEIKADTPPIEANLSMDEIRRIVDNCKFREKAIFSLIFQGIMDSERFTIVNHGWRLLEPQLKDGQEWITFRFEYRKKNEHPYFTIWHRDGDAIRFLKEYLKERGTPKVVGTDSRGQPIYEAIFLNRQGQSFNKDNLKQAWITAGTRAGVVERPRPVCKKCGHQMRKIQEKWSKALPYLNLWSQASDLTTIPTKVADLEDRLNKSNLKILQTEEKVNLLVGFLTSQNIKGTDSATQEFLDRIRKQSNTFTS